MMQSDRELLEAAARAAGIDAKWYRGLGMGIAEDAAFPKRWDPMTSDADAFRLAVRLGLSVEVHFDSSQPLPWLRISDKAGNWTHCNPRDFQGNELEQTRRCIVFAAAKLAPTTPPKEQQP